MLVGVVVLGLLLRVRPCLPCETGVAHVDSVLSVPRSLLANADVALLKNYVAPSLATCMEECCAGTYGSCSVASFKKNTTKANCMHFYCRPLNKCKFLSSTSTDSFSFSSELRRPSTTAQSPKSSTKEDIATFSAQQFALKNDNTTVKPRKGVDDTSPVEDLHSKPGGVKPRKGVSTEDVPHSELLPGSHSRSNVKARKGVEPFPNSTEISFDDSQAHVVSATEGSSSAAEDIDSSDFMSALQKAFEDDTHSVQPSSTITTASGMSATISTSSQTNYDRIATNTVEISTTILSSFSPESNDLVSSSTTETMPVHASLTRQYVSAAVEEKVVPYTSPPTPVLSTQRQTHSHGVVPLLGEGFHQKLVSDTQEETDRRYKSSMHLVLSLVFGLLVLFAVLGIVAKRVYDGWLRRDYYRMNYLIDGIYNGVD